MISGKIPESLGECTSLQLLYLHDNNFQGAIPLSLSSMKGLQALDLAHNNLSGEIPQFLASFADLIMLNLSFNDLEGVVPKTGAFRHSSATSLQGNNTLCGGIPDFHLPECSSSTDRKRRRLPVQKTVIVAVIAGLACVALLILLLSIYGLRRKQRQSPEKRVAPPFENHPLQFVS